MKTHYPPVPWQFALDCGDFEGGIHYCVYDAKGNKLATVWVRLPVGAGTDAERLKDEAFKQAETIADLMARAPTLEAENRWLKEAAGVRDAEDQRTIDTLKEKAAMYDYLRAQKWYSSDIAVVLNPKKNLLVGAQVPFEEMLDDEIRMRMKRDQA